MDSTIPRKRLAEILEAIARMKEKYGLRCVNILFDANAPDQRNHRDEYFDAARCALASGETLWRLAVASTARPLKLPGEQLIEWSGAQRWLVTPASPPQVRAEAELAGCHAVLFLAQDKSPRGVRAAFPAAGAHPSRA